MLGSLPLYHLPHYHFSDFGSLLVGGGVDRLNKAGTLPVLEHGAGAVVVVVFMRLAFAYHFVSCSSPSVFVCLYTFTKRVFLLSAIVF